jgi:hypothetical protein
MGEFRKGGSWTWVFKMVDEDDFATPEPGTSPSVQVSKDGGAFSTATNTVGEIASGWYRLDLTSGETDADVLVLKATASGCAQTDEAFYLPTQTISSGSGSIAGAVLAEPVNDHKGTSDSLAEAINLVRRAVAGKRDQTIATGVIRVYDTDDSTVLTTLVPSEDGGVLTLDDS